VEEFSRRMNADDTDLIMRNLHLSMSSASIRGQNFFGGRNRDVFNPFAKVINGKDVEVSAKLGMRDGSGDWDDTYEGTVTVAVTAVVTKG
jgi:hypothetical protein